MIIFFGLNWLDDLFCRSMHACLCFGAGFGIGADVLVLLDTFVHRVPFSRTNHCYLILVHSGSYMHNHRSLCARFRYERILLIQTNQNYGNGIQDTFKIGKYFSRFIPRLDEVTLENSKVISFPHIPFGTLIRRSYLNPPN